MARRRQTRSSSPKAVIPWSDREYIAVKRKVRAAFEKWILLLGLRYWQCDLEHRRIPFPDKRDDGHVILAKCFCKWQYRQVTVEYSAFDMAKMNKEEVERVIVHELCHALVNEMRESDEDGKHEESVVSGLTSAFIWVHDRKKS